MMEITDGDYFLERIRGRVGTGDTARDSSMENIWRVAGRGEGNLVRMELLDNNHEPSGYVEEVTPDDFGVRFIHQPDFTPVRVDPKSAKVEKINSRAERHLGKREYNSAEFEFTNALKLDEDNVRANYGLGRTYVETGEKDKAQKVFQKLSRLEAVMQPENKHVFNECGIQLRMLGLFQDAMAYYHRALKLAPEDENLWFNMGRALCEGGQAQPARAALQRALKINPNLEEARMLMSRLEGK